MTKVIGQDVVFENPSCLVSTRGTKWHSARSVLIGADPRWLTNLVALRGINEQS